MSNATTNARLVELTDEEFMTLYRKVDAETALSKNSREVDGVVGHLCGLSADEVCARFIVLMDHSG